MVGLKNGHIHKNLTKNGEPQRYSWWTQKTKKKSIIKHVGFLTSHNGSSQMFWLSHSLMILNEEKGSSKWFKTVESNGECRHTKSERNWSIHISMLESISVFMTEVSTESLFPLTESCKTTLLWFPSNKHVLIYGSEPNLIQTNWKLCKKMTADVLVLSYV